MAALTAPPEPTRPRERERRLGESLLHRLSTTLAREAQPEAVVRAAVDALVAEVGASMVGVFLVDEEANVMRPAYTVNYPAGMLERLRAVPLEVPAASSAALHSGEVQIVDPATPGSDDQALTRDLARQAGVGVVVVVPLLAGGRRLGTLVYGLPVGRTFGEAEVALLGRIGEVVSSALERARLEERLARRAEEAELLVAIATAAAGEHDVGRILTAALDRLSRVIPFNGGSIALVEGDDLVVRAAVGPFAASILGRRLPRGEDGRSWAVVKTGETLLVDDVQAAGAGGSVAAGSASIRSYLAVPLAWRGRVFGLLEVDSAVPGGFRRADTTVLQGVAAVLSGPIELAERYAAEVRLGQELADAKHRLEALLEHAPMGIAFLDAAGRLAYANRAYAEMLRLPIEDVRALALGRPVSAAGTLAAATDRWAGDPHQLRGIVEETARLGRTARAPDEPAARPPVLVHDFPLRDPAQHFRRIAAPLFGDDGALVGHVVLYADVTAERQALTDAERALTVRDQFLTVASHELRTPLTPIKAATGFLLRLGYRALHDPARLTRQLSIIDAQVDRLGVLVGDLLDVARIQAGRLELRLESVDLVALLARVVHGWDEGEGSRIRLHTPARRVPDAGDESAAVLGRWDPHRLEQVAVNLLDNALKYSPAGRPVDVHVWRDDADALLTVQDQGIGLPPGFEDSLFAPFARAANASERNYGGLGLGLYISCEIVRRHGGSILAESPGPNRGTSFTVRLPLAPAQADATPPRQAA